MVYFKHSEFDSPDKEGTGILMDSVFLSLLEEARAIAKIPFAITSGYRTEKYNNDLIKRGYSASKNSSHLKGLACDIACNNSRERFIILSALMDVGFMRIGVASTFIHVDLDLTKPQNIVWLYK